MQDSLIKKLQEAKCEYAQEGFFIIGVFGSYARDEVGPDSDLDILFSLSPEFEQKNPGWDAYARIFAIKTELEQQMGIPVDLANEDALDRVAQHFILPEVIRVA